MWTFEQELRFAHLVCTGNLVYSTVHVRVQYTCEHLTLSLSPAPDTSFRLLLPRLIISLSWLKQRSAVLITSLHLEARHDNLIILGALGADERSFSGDMTPRRLDEIGEMGVAFHVVQSSRVNITFVSDGSVEKEGFELQVFPFYRICFLKSQLLIILIINHSQ